MFQALLITFREGLESFLIVGVIVAYLRKTGRAPLVRGVGFGLAAAAALSVTGAVLWFRALDRGDDINQSLYEGIGALVAAVLVGVLLWQVQRVGRRLKSHIEARIERAVQGNAVEGTLSRPRAMAIVAVALVTTLFVTREMVEALLIISVRAFRAQNAVGLAVGSAVGLLLAGVYAWLWSRHGQKLRLATTLRATAVFLMLFLVQLVIWGVHELAESGVINGSQAFHDATERLGPDGDIGQVFAFIVGSVPLIAAVAGIVQIVTSRRRATEPQPASSQTAEASQ